MLIGSLQLQDDLSPARWISDRIHPFAQDVGSLIPEGFDAYVRVLHPAYRHEGNDRVAVTWAEIAAANGRTVHPEMQWPHISGVWEHSGGRHPGVWDQEPEVGTLPRDHAAVLADLLVTYTATPERVWFGVWDGWGGSLVEGVLAGGARRPRRRDERLPAAPRLELPGRSYYLLSGSIDAVTESLVGPPAWQSANLWWPEDRAWCVATEIDFAWTYVGGRQALIEDLGRHPGLEVVPTRIDHGVTYDSDQLNPRPPGGPGS